MPKLEIAIQKCINNEQYFSPGEVQSNEPVKSPGKRSIKVDFHEHCETDAIYQEVTQTEAEYCKLQTLR